MTITVRQAEVRGERRWCVDARSIGKGRQFFASEREANRIAAGMRSETGSGWAALTDAERRELAVLHQAATEAGTSLGVVWREWQAGARVSVSAPRITLSEACRQCADDKEASGRRSVYVRHLRSYLARFARGREEIQLRSIGTREVQEWIDGLGTNLHSKANGANRISTLFSWAIRRGYVDANPCRRIESITIEAKPPLILTVDQCEKALRYVREYHTESLAWLVVALLAGVRPTEADRLTWADVDLGKGIITVSAAASKVRTRRFVHLLPNAAAWLAVCERKEGPLSLIPWERRRAVEAVRDMLGMQRMPTDLLRHTAASYWLAHRQDAGAVAHELGNSAGILLRVYRELVSREDAERWVGLRPE